MERARTFPILILSSLTFFPPQLPAQQFIDDDQALLYGTWELDLERSQFIEREKPRRQVMIFEPHEDGLLATVIFTGQNGVEQTVSYVATQDGTPSPLQGSRDFDAVIMESRGPYQATATFTHAGNEVGHAERRISMDGRTMTVEVIRMGNLSSRAVFLKQDE